MPRFSHIFLGPKRLRSGWRILTYSLAILILAIILTLGLKILRYLLGLGPKLLLESKRGITIPLEILLPTVLIISWLWVRYLDRRPSASLGLYFHPWWWKELSWGLFLGAFIDVIISALLYISETGQPFWAFNPIAPSYGWFTLISSFLMIALWEEFFSGDISCNPL